MNRKRAFGGHELLFIITLVSIGTALYLPLLKSVIRVSLGAGVVLSGIVLLLATAMYALSWWEERHGRYTSRSNIFYSVVFYLSVLPAIASVLILLLALGRTFSRLLW
jgi:hypothetical protein